MTIDQNDILTSKTLAQRGSTVWHVLSAWLCPVDHTMLFWWNTTGPLLAKLLSEGHYDVHVQYQHLLFHYHYIIGSLGPQPSSKGLPKLWKSFMTDDFSPLEFSWSWDGALPSVRYSIEAIGAAAGTAMDPFNQHTTIALVEKLQSAYPKVNWQWFEHFLTTLIVPGKHGCATSGSMASSSSLGLAFELQRGGGIGIKAYFSPTKSLQTNLSPLDVISQAIRRLEQDGDKFASFSHLLDFVATDARGAALEFLGVAVDCVEPHLSRLKVYARSPDTSFETVRKIFALGYPSCSSQMEQDLQKLHELWILVLQQESEAGIEATLPFIDHQTAGILYNFDIKLGSNLPIPKVYMPVKHYSTSDFASARGLASFLRNAERDDFMGGYMRVLEEFHQYRSLEKSRGLQTYISCGFKRGIPSITSYLGPNVYRNFREMI
jgi:DMATS type aromatic prenyltransferase